MQIPLLDETLMSAIVTATHEGLQVAGVEPKLVGCSRYIPKMREVSVIISLVGGSSGAVTLNANRATVGYLAGKILGESAQDLTSETLDAIGEITNIICGRIKAILSTTEWRTDRMSCPSVIVGNSYFISNYCGMQTVSVEFELEEMPLFPQDDRLFSLSISLAKT